MRILGPIEGSVSLVTFGVLALAFLGCAKLAVYPQESDAGLPYMSCIDQRKLAGAAFTVPFGDYPHRGDA